ncbi:MAG: hypothetical protein Q8L79_06620 [Methylobacter sp.]|nr:hypothetical protein [Methylobacter sp.]MDP1664788.1 hypothetical protein [Methylobacter sp.]
MLDSAQTGFDPDYKLYFQLFKEDIHEYCDKTFIDLVARILILLTYREF